MRRLPIFTALLFCCWIHQVQGQSPAAESGPKERIYVATDKDNYLSGEIVWMKLISTDDEGAPISFSRIGYVELAGEEQSHVRERIEIRDGIGEGTLVIPSTLPTGYYRLVGYTRWMRNEGEAIFFEKRIGVVNPALAEVSRGSGQNVHSAEAVSPPASTGGIQVSANRNTYSPRSEVHIEVSGIPADIHTLGISVTAADPLGGFTRPALGVWQEALEDVVSSESVARYEYEAEYEGAIITGKLVSAETGEAVYSPSLLPLISFPGDEINLFGGSIDETGKVVFRTARIAGFDEAVTTMRGNETEQWRIDLDTPFSQEGIIRPQPTFPLDGIDREAMLRQSLAMQLQYSYINDSLIDEQRPSPMFIERPLSSYKMEEWKRFATMREVMSEFVKSVQFSRFNQGDGKRYLSVANTDFGLSQTNSLVLIDGIPIIDHEIIYNYNPLLVDRIDVYRDRYLFGSNLFFGMVAFYSAQNDYPELQPDPFTQILPYPSPQARRLFYAPDYNNPARLASRLPDYRHTLYWNAKANIDGNGRTGVRFFTSDMTGDYQVLVEGITFSGEIVSAVCRIEVR